MTTADGQHGEVYTREALVAFRNADGEPGPFQHVIDVTDVRVDTFSRSSNVESRNGMKRSTTAGRGQQR